jgi:hypothetical protein
VKPITATQTGWSYVSHTVAITLAAHYSSGLNSGPAMLGACVLPPQSYYGYATAGTFPAQLYLFESEDEGSLTFRGAADPTRWVFYSANTGGTTLYDSDDLGLAALDPGGPAGTFPALNIGKTRYNSGADWDFVFTPF